MLRIGAGQSVQKIAYDLQLRPKTVESYRQIIKRKLDLHSGADVTRYAMQGNLDQSSRSPAARNEESRLDWASPDEVLSPRGAGGSAFLTDRLD